MSVKIRLKRMGSKKKPFYRMVVADERAPRDGRFIEELGYYNPMTKELNIDGESAKKWISNGAQPTETVRSLLKKCGAIATDAAKAQAPKAAEAAAEPVVEAAAE